MAIPKIFISSTYYDLLHVRVDLESFVRGMGYEPILHERNSIPYPKEKTLEDSCIDEIKNCDVLVCIIGNKYGTESEKTTYSITMNELTTAITQKKQVFVFIQRDVDTENQIYFENKETENFRPHFADDIKIHEFISNLKTNFPNVPRETFAEVGEIVGALKNQFAGLFQSFLQQSATPMESKTYYDFQTISNEMNAVLNSVKENNKNFSQILMGTAFYIPRSVSKILEFLEIQNRNLRILIGDKSALNFFLGVLGFEKVENDNIFELVTEFKRTTRDEEQILTISDDLFDKNGYIVRVIGDEVLENGLKFEKRKIEEDPFAASSVEITDDDLPF